MHLQLALLAPGKKRRRRNHIAGHGWTLSILACVFFSCAKRPALAFEKPMSGLEARYRMSKLGLSGTREVATKAYRNVVSKVLYSQCEMLPSDSQAYELRARRCGAFVSAYAGITRLLLEQAAEPKFVRPAIVHNRFRWVDFPYRGCGLW